MRFLLEQQMGESQGTKRAPCIIIYHIHHRNITRQWDSKHCYISMQSYSSSRCLYCPGPYKCPTTPRNCLSL